MEKEYEKRRMHKAFDKLGSPWGSLGVPWGAQGNFLRFVENWTPNTADPAEAASGLQLASPLSRARGQDDVSLKETPSNNT